MFASDGVSPVGGVAPIGTGRSSDVTAANPAGVEPQRGGLIAKGIQTQGATRPMLQIPVVRYPGQKAGEVGPGLSTMFGKYFMLALNFLAGPQETRKPNRPTEEERISFLSGSPLDQPDPETRGLNIEPVSQMGTSEPGQMAAKEVSIAWDGGPQPLTNMPVGGMTDDQTRQVQGWDTNTHEDLTAYRASFPASSVNQGPTVAKNIVLKQVGGAGTFFGEINIPDGAVTMRITWTLKDAGTPIDLWWSLTGQAFIPLGAGQPAAGITQSDVANDTVLLNPDPTTRYMVKGKRAVSFAAAVVATVHTEFYLQVS